MLRRCAELLLLGCLLVVPAVAQRGGHGGGGGFHGGGMGGFRGGGFGGFRGGGFGGFRGGGFRGGFGGFRGGRFGGFRGGFNRGWWGNGWWGPGWWGWGWGGWPSYSLGWGWDSPYSGYSSYPNWGYSYPDTSSYASADSYSYPYTYSYPTDSSGYASRYAPSEPAYSGPTQTYCVQPSGRPFYLIKLTYQDRVWLARDYWYTPGTLNFVTTQRDLNMTPINTIDRGATFQLNRDCGVNFQFPK